MCACVREVEGRGGVCVRERHRVRERDKERETESKREKYRDREREIKREIREKKLRERNREKKSFIYHSSFFRVLFPSLTTSIVLISCFLR